MCITYNMKADILEFEYLPFIIDSDNAILLESIIRNKNIKNISI